MTSVYSDGNEAKQALPLAAFIEASSLHIGAAAAAASLRHDLVGRKRVSAAVFDEAYAVARLTPGTNLLAMYTLLGKHFAGWRGAGIALAIATVTPALLAMGAAWAYVTFADHSITAGVMQGARAGGLAVFLWAVVRLIRPQLAHHRVRGGVLAVAVLISVTVLRLPQLAILLVAGVIGALFLREEP